MKKIPHVLSKGKAEKCLDSGLENTALILMQCTSSIKTSYIFLSQLITVLTLITVDKGADFKCFQAVLMMNKVPAEYEVAQVIIKSFPIVHVCAK